MGFKRDWKGSLRQIRRTFSHRYVGGTCTGGKHVVLIVTEIRQEGPSKGRWITEEITSDEARKRAAQLLQAANEADAWNREN